MAQVQCPICKQQKDSTFDFYWQADKRSGRCKECQKAYVKAWIKGHRVAYEKQREAHGNR